MENRTFTANFKFAAGKSAGIYEVKTELDSQYDRANGVAVYLNKTGGITTFQLGLRSDTQTFVQPTNVAYFQADAACPKTQRMTRVSILCDKTATTITVVLPEPLTEDLDVDVVFELERADRGR
jgi:hypothetical protein